MNSAKNKYCQRLDKLLEKQNKNFPVRSPHLTEQIKNELDVVVDYFDRNRRNLKWEPQCELIVHAKKMDEHGVILCGSMKSGTTLLLELLDGHSQLNVLPGDSWFWVRLSDINKQEEFSIESWRRHWLKRIINPMGQAPFWIFGINDHNYFEFLHYMDYWYSVLPENFRRPLLTTVLSYFCANPYRPGDAKKWVEKTPGNEFKVTFFHKYFPEAKFIHIVRDPRENLASLKRLYNSRNWLWKTRSMVRSLSDSYAAAIKNQKYLGKEKYLIIRYEDLTHDPRKLMQEVASFLGIPWQESLMVPTVNLLTTKTNTMYEDRQVSGSVRPSVSDKWRSELSNYEQGLIHAIRKQAEEVGCNWELNNFDHIKRLVYGWLLVRLRMRSASELK